MIDKLPAMYFFPADYISGTRTLTMQQRGIYCDLLFFSHTYNGKGLPNNIDELCRMIFPMTFNQEEIEKLRSDLTLVLEQKFFVENDRYFNKRQQIEFVRGLELSNKRSEARKKKKFDNLKQMPAIATEQPIWPVHNFRETTVAELSDILSRSANAGIRHVWTVDTDVVPYAEVLESPVDKASGVHSNAVNAWQILVEDQVQSNGGLRFGPQTLTQTA